MREWYDLKGDRDKKLVVMDNHSSHLDIDTVLWASDNRMLLCGVPPQTTSVTNPLDTTIFGPSQTCFADMKSEYVQGLGVSFLREQQGAPGP